MKEVLESISEFVDDCLGPLGSKGFGPWPEYLRDFAIQLLATLLLFIVIRHFFWKPITKMLEAKRDAIDKELDDAKAHHKNAKELEQALLVKEQESKAQIQELLKNAELQGNIRKEEIINEAKKEASYRIKMAEEEIASEIKGQTAELKNQIVEIAFMAASEIVGKEVDKKHYLKTVEKIIDSGLRND